MNDLSKRQFRILNALLKNEPLSSEYLSKIIGASSKTIRKDILDMKEILQVNGARIDSKTGNGFILTILNHELFDLFMGNYVDGSQEKILSLPLNYQRAHYIVRRFLSTQDYLRINDFAEALFTSRATITQDMPLVKKILARFNLKLVSRAKYGLKIQGLEHAIRSCFVYESEFYHENILNADEEEFGAFISVNAHFQQEAEAIIISTLKSYTYIELSYQSIMRLVQVINLIHKRGQLYPLELYEENDRVDTQKRNSYKVSTIVALRCERNLGVRFTEEDLIFFNNCFSGYRNITSYDSLQNRTNYFRYYDLAVELIEHLSTLNGYENMRRDNILIDSLARHFLSMMIRMKNHISFYYGDPSMKRMTTTSVELAAQTAQFLKERYQVLLNEDEVMQLVYVFSPIFGRYLPTVKKKRIIIISHVSITVGNMIAERFERNFSGYLDSIDVIELYQLKELDLSTTDFIFTTLDRKVFKPLKISVPIVEIQTFFPETYKPTLRNLLSDAQASLEMMKRLFDPRCFFTDITASSKQEFLALAAQKLRDVFELDQDIEQDLIERDQWISAEMGKNIGRLRFLRSHGETSFIAIFLLKRPLLWDTETIQIFQVWHQGTEPEFYLYSESGYTGNVLKTMFGYKDGSVAILQNPTYACFLNLLQETVQEIKSLQLR